MLISLLLVATLQVTKPEVIEIKTSVAKPAESRIQWRVEAGFAPFAWTVKPDETSKHWLPNRGKKDFETFDEWYMRLSNTGITKSPYSDFFVPPPIGKGSPWNAVAGHYRDEYSRPTEVTIRAWVTGLRGQCEWKVQSSKVAQLKPVSFDCEAEAELLVPLSGAEITVTSAGSATITESVAIDHRVVVGMGDSYASGEGNPDIPTRWRNEVPKEKTYNWFNPKSDDFLVANDAQWFDTACRRSFWSHQTYTAMRLAAENPHRLVTFLHYACSGAEIFDGMLVRQKRIPGIKGLVPRSQLAAAVLDLCHSGNIVARSNLINEFAKNVKKKSQGFFKMNNYNRHGLDLRECGGKQRIPDLVLISIGGNDAGFAQLAAWAILPVEVRSDILNVFYGIGLKSEIVCPIESDVYMKGKCKRSDDDLINQIERRYALLGEAVKNLIKVTPDKVVITSLPDPLRLDSVSGKVCSDEGRVVNYNNAWDGARGFLKKHNFPHRWQFNVTEYEAKILAVRTERKNKTLAEGTLTKLRAAVSLGATSNGFIFASDTSEAFVGHGWCEPSKNDLPIALPSSSPNEWHCDGTIKGPACWRAYHPAKRYTRTLNDSLLTQASSRGDGINGALHPTAQGQAAIATRLIKYVNRRAWDAELR